MSALDTADRFHLRRLNGADSRTAFWRVRFGRAGILSPPPADLAPDLVAFANGAGGSVFVGAASGCSFGGLGEDLAAAAERWVAEAAAVHCHPPIHPRFDRVSLPERQGRQTGIVLARIPRGLFLHRTRDGGWYGRWGPQTRPFTHEDLRPEREERALCNERFDRRAVGWATPDALDDDRLRPEFARRRGDPEHEVLRYGGILGPDEEDPEVERPTVAGLPAFGANPTDFLLSARVEAAVFAGTGAAPGDPVHAETLTGPLVAQVDAAVGFVSRFAGPEGVALAGAAPAGAVLDRERAAPEAASSVRGTAASPGREAGRAIGGDALGAIGREAGGAFGRGTAAAPAYPPMVVFEALANAVAHRNYTLPDDPIRLSLFADRLEVATPGGLPRSLTLEELPFVVRTRNQRLAAFLRRQRSRILDRAVLRSRGWGVPRYLSRGGATHDLRDGALVLTLRPDLPPVRARRFGPGAAIPDRRGLRP